MGHFHAQALLISALCVAISEGRADSPLSEAVTATLEENVALSCHVSNLTDPKSYRVRWIKSSPDTGQSKVILVRPKTPTIKDAQRVKWQANEQGQMSLFLTKLQQSDEGMYSCEIWKDWDCEIRNISLRVKACKVLRGLKVRPSTRVNLTCPVDLTQGPKNTLWERLRGDNTETLSHETSHTIWSARSSDSGWYKCKFMLGETQRCFEINLKVENVAVTTSEPEVEDVAVTTSVPALTNRVVILETKLEGSSGALIALIVSATIIGIVITAAVAGRIAYNRCNNRRGLQPTRQTHRPITGPAKESPAAYEIVDFTPSNDLLSRVNSFYEDQEENMCTFHY